MEFPTLVIQSLYIESAPVFYHHQIYWVTNDVYHPCKWVEMGQNWVGIHLILARFWLIMTCSGKSEVGRLASLLGYMSSPRCLGGKLWYLPHNCIGDTIVHHQDSELDLSSNLWLVEVSANQKKYYPCNIFSHWLRAGSTIDRKQALMSYQCHEILSNGKSAWPWRNYKNEEFQFGLNIIKDNIMICEFSPKFQTLCGICFQTLWNIFSPFILGYPKPQNIIKSLYI